MIKNKTLFLILVFEFGVVINVPSLNPLALGGTRTELIEDIWDSLNAIRGPPVQLQFQGPEEAEPISNRNYECKLNWPELTSVPLPNGKVLPNGKTVRHQIHFRKDDFPGNFGQDRDDNARVNVIFASKRSNWAVAYPIVRPQNFYSNLETLYFDVIGFAVCRRQKIERVEVFEEGWYCDIETWLLFLCMRDDDVQANDLRDPEDYNTYLGGRSESSVFMDMARQRCRPRIGAVPRDARIAPPGDGVTLRLELATKAFVLSSILANYDYVLIRKRRRRPPPKRESAGQQDVTDCRDMSLLRNDHRLYRRVEERGGEIRQEYDFHWFFCRFIDDPPYRNVYPEKPYKSSNPSNSRLIKALKNQSDLNMHGSEL